MGSEIQTIEVHEATARGVTVAEIVAELLPLSTDTETMAELDRRWASAIVPDGTVSNEDVTPWLETWGTPAFRPWHDR